MDGLSSDKVAAQLAALSEKVDSIALVAAQHPLIADDIDMVNTRGVPVTAIIITTFKTAAAARELVDSLLKKHPDLCELFISGGAIAALRDTPHRSDFDTVGYELFDATRSALIHGPLSMVISHPAQTLATETMQTMVEARRPGADGMAQRVTLSFEIHTPEVV